jgi:hypothetical protein
MARDERLERDVAVKVLARDRIVGGRFEREARAAARLSHPAIVTLYEAAVDDDGAYLVSELVRGATLSQLVEAGRLSDRDIVQIGVALCDALVHAHGEGVVHRDVKPSNVLVAEPPRAPGQVAKLTDFGVARLIGADTLTRTGDVVGTAAYMAPEQADGREAGAPADLYSLALVLYEALTGVNPVGLGTQAQRARRLGAHLPPLRRQRRDLPGDLGHALDLALRPRPRERGTVEELRGDLVSSLAEVEDHPGVVEPAWPRRPRREQAADAHDWQADHPAQPSRDDPAQPRSPGRDDVDAPGSAGQDALRRVPSELRWPDRVLAGAAAGLAAAWLVTLTSAQPPVAPVGAGVLAGLLVAALPRLGWLALSVGLAGWLAAADRPGLAVLLLPCAILPVLLMPRYRAGWPLAAWAAGLGALGLAGAWPAAAARAATPWRRVALGGIGWIWVCAAGFLAGRGLYTRLPPGLPHGWSRSLTQTADHVISHAFAPALLVPAALWGVGALVLPWLARGRLPVQIVLITMWSAALASGTVTALRLAHAGVQAPAGTVILGAVAGGIVALAPGLWRERMTGFAVGGTRVA